MDNNQILGIRFDDFDNESEFLRRLLSEFVDAKATHRSKLIAHLNVHGLNIAYTDQKYRELLNKADVLFFDSIGLKIAAKLFLNLNVSFASTPPEWMHDFFKMVPAGTKVFFVGDEPNVVENYNNLFFESFPQLKASGYHHGFFLKDPLEETQLLAELRKCRPDIVLVGMGMPVQEFWIERIRNKVNVPMFIPVGAYFQRMIGVQKRPSRFIVKMGLEWVHRLIFNPKTLFKRYVIGNSIFMYRVFRYRFKQWGPAELGRIVEASKNIVISKEDSQKKIS